MIVFLLLKVATYTIIRNIKFKQTVTIVKKIMKYVVIKNAPFYRNMIREGVFNRLIFKNYFFRKVLEHGKQLPETEIENVCSLYRGGDCGEKENLANM